MPPHCNIDHQIQLIDGSTPIIKKAYSLLREQATVIKKYIDEMLGKGFLSPSNLPYATPVLIVKKLEGGFHVNVDYCALNALTIKNQNTLSLIWETFVRFSLAKINTKFDIIAAFNEIRIREGNEKKTAFHTRYELYEYIVMPFRLCNAPKTFQSYINETFQEFLDDSCTAYLNNILIYNKSISTHTKYVQQVLSKLRAARLFLDICKYDFSIYEIKYLVLIISTMGLKIDCSKVDTIQNWKIPCCVKDV